MASEETANFWALYFFVPFFVWIGIIIVLAALGKDCGIRRLYINTLLIIFEWGRVKITKHTDDKWGRVQITKYPEDQWGAQRIRNHEATLQKGASNKKASTVVTKMHPGILQNLANLPGSLMLKPDRESIADGEVAGSSTNDVRRKSQNKNYLTVEDDDEDLMHRMSSKKSRDNMIHKFSVVESAYLEFKLSDILYFANSGIEAIVEDEVTHAFAAEELNSWNLLTRTNTKLEFISVRLTLLWFAGWVLRYIILLPLRLICSVYAIGLLILGTAIIGYLPKSKRRRWLYERLNLMCYRVMGRAFSAVITYHNRENLAKSGGICVANHTSPIDIIILSADNTYAMVGQSQPGFINIIQSAMSRAETHIWFDRAEAKDRLTVAKRLQEHVQDVNKLPILIFPEGTCINNTSIMMFKKGSFEVGGTIYPVAIKYDPRFADAFWNSSQESFVKHMLMIMTSWALVVDVWYLPPQFQLPGENAMEFANRVKANIAAKGGLVDLEWDGSLKRNQPKSSMMQKQQEEYSKKLKGE